MSKTLTQDIAKSAPDFTKIRSQFPVLNREMNGKPLVYLDNAASSQMPKVVADRINTYHTEEHANVHRGIHTLSQEATDAYEESRKILNKFLNVPDDGQLLYTSGTTDAINTVSYSFGNEFLSEGDEILISHMEHHSNIVPWQMAAKRTGAKLKIIPINDKGELIWEEFLDMLNERTKIVSIMHICNSLGTINPVEKIISEAHKRDIPVLIDGAQAAPHTKIDLEALDPDFYAFSAHKMCGPTGIGVLYAKKEWLEKMPPFRGGGEMIDKVTFEETTYAGLPHKFEAGTPPIMAAIGMGKAAEFLMEIGLENIEKQEQSILDYATERLSELEGIRFIGTADHKASLISFVLGDIHPHDTGTILDQQGIAIRTGHHCAQPVMQHFDIPATARASFSFYNNREDVDRLIEGLKTVHDLFI